MNLKALNDRVIVKRLEAEDTSKGGIILSQGSKEKPSKGKVLAVGPGRRLSNGTFVETTVKVGQVVYFGKYGGSTLKVNDEELLFFKEEEILAVEE